MRPSGSPELAICCKPFENFASKLSERNENKKHMKTRTLDRSQREGRSLRPMKKSVSLSLISGIATMLVLMSGPSSQAQQFVDVSGSAGIDGTSLNKSWGSPVWGDINNDGYLDVLVSTHGVQGTNRPFIYINNGNGTFTNTQPTSGIVPGSPHDPVSPDSRDWHGRA